MWEPMRAEVSCSYEGRTPYSNTPEQDESAAQAAVASADDMVPIPLQEYVLLADDDAGSSLHTVTSPDEGDGLGDT